MDHQDGLVVLLSSRWKTVRAFQLSTTLSVLNFDVEHHRGGRNIVPHALSWLLRKEDNGNEEIVSVVSTYLTRA